MDFKLSTNRDKRPDLEKEPTLMRMESLNLNHSHLHNSLDMDERI